MNGMRKGFCFLMATMLMAFALPAVAQQKIFSLNMAPTTPVTSPAALTATFKNESPNGNSSFNSLTLTAPAGITITSVAQPPSGTATIVNGGRTVNIVNMSPIGKGQTFVVSLIATAGASSCTSTSGDWSAVPWTGSNLTGNTFDVVPAKSSLATTVTNTSCNYSLTGLPASVAAGSSTNVTAITYTNLASTGGLSIKSLRLSVAGGLKISAPVVSSGTATVTGGGTTVEIVGISVGPSQTFVLGLTVTAAASCVASSSTWNSPGTASVYSGTTLGTGVAFSPTSGSANVPTSVTAQACSVSISAPSSAAVGVPFLVTINLTGGPGGANVNLTSNCALSGGGSKTATGYSAVYTVTINALGSCSLTATADQGYGQTTLSSFKVFGGVLGCGNSNNYDSSNGNTNFALDPYGNGPFVGGTGWGLRRGPNWNDLTGANCVLVNYTFTLDATNNVATLIWDKLTLQKALFEYVIVWTPVGVDPLSAGATAGWTTRRPLVSWTTPPDYVPALACVVDDNQIGLAAFPTIPNVAPFNTYAPTHPYYPGNQALLCIAQQGFTAVGGTDINGNTLVQYWDKVLDAADSSVKFP